MSTAPSPRTDWLLLDRLARTVCEVDPRPHSPFAVAVVLEVLGHTDRTAQDSGWPDLFALAADVYERVEFVAASRRRGTAREERDEDDPPLLRDSLASGAAQQAAWLVMVVVTLAWGVSVWASERLSPLYGEALLAGIVGSLILSGGFQYAVTRRLLFHVAQRDLVQARAYLRRVFAVGGLVVAAASALVAAVLWAVHRGSLAGPLLASGYFLLHGNYRIASVPLQALHDVPGIVVSTAGALGFLFLAYRGLVAAGAEASLAVAVAQLLALLGLWAGCGIRGLSILASAGRSDPDSPAPPRRGLAPRGRVLLREAAPWFALGVLYYLFFFATRPVAWALPLGERLRYEWGMDLGLLAIIPSALGASWLLRRFTRELRERMRETSLVHVGAFRREVALSFGRRVGEARLWGASWALLLLVLVHAGASFLGVPGALRDVLRLAVGGTALLLPPFALAFGLLVSLGVLGGALGVVGAGLLLHGGLGLAVARFGSAPLLVGAFLASAAAMGELAVWRALRAVRRIDRHYYALF